MKKLLLDIVPVLVGILLALFVNNWRQLASERNYIESSVASIIKENKENIEELKYSINRQVVFMDTLRFYLQDDQLTLAHILLKTKGLTTPDLKSSTWKFLIQDSKHTLVSYEFINRLAEIEKYEKLVDRYNQKVGDIIFQPAYFDDPNLKKVAYILFDNFSSIERTMIDELEGFNKYAEETYKINSEKEKE